MIGRREKEKEKTKDQEARERARTQEARVAPLITVSPADIGESLTWLGNLGQEDTSKFPCKILKVNNNFKEGDDCNFMRRPPTATKVEQDGISKTSANTPPRLEGSSFDDKRPCLKYGQTSCKLGKECIFRHDPEHVAKHQAARSKPNEESVSKSRSRGALTTSDSQWKVAMNNARSSEIGRAHV